MKKRDVSIELLRIIACMIVISLHIGVSYVVDNRISFGRVLLRTSLFDGVPVFFMIMGFFLFNGKSFTGLLKKVFRGVMLPTFIIMLIIQILYPWTSGGTGFIQGIFLRETLSTELFGKIMQWNADIRGCSQDHFVFTYVGIVLWFPILRFLCRKDESADKARHYVIGLTLLAMVITDMQQFILLPIGPIYTFMTVSINICMVLIGYELSRRKERLFYNRKAGFIALATFIGANLLKAVGQIFLFRRAFSNGVLEVVDKEAPAVNYFAGTSTFLCVLTSISLFVFVCSISISNEKIKDMIRYIASKTFYIYLIHWVVFNKLDSLGIRDYIWSATEKVQLGVLVYTLLYAILIFLVSMGIVIIVENIICVLKTVIVKLEQKMKIKYSVGIHRLCILQMLYLLLQLANVHYIAACILAAGLILVMELSKSIDWKDCQIIIIISFFCNLCLLIAGVKIIHIDSLLMSILILIADIPIYYIIKMQPKGKEWLSICAKR